MKKIILIGVLFCLSFFYAKGQIEKGSLMIGGSSSLSLSLSESDIIGATTIIYFAPQFSYFIIDNLSIGVQIPLEYYYSIRRYDNPDRDVASTILENSSLEISAFTRYYIGKHRIKPYLYLDAGIGKLKSRVQNPNNQNYTGTTDVFKYEYGGGIAFFINTKLSLDLNIGYHSRTKKYNSDGSESTTNKYFSRIGFSIVL